MENNKLPPAFVVKRPDIDALIAYLQKQAPLFAPQRKGKNSYRYAPVAAPEDVVLDYPRTIQPLKKYFLPPTEVLLTYNYKENTYERPALTAEERIFFAIHSYELQALKRLDESFVSGSPESNYITRRQKAVFVGISYTPDEYHFGPSVGIAADVMEGFSLYLLQQSDYYLLMALDERGRELLRGFQAEHPVSAAQKEPLFSEKRFPKTIKLNHNRLPDIFNRVYKADVWKDVAKRCLGCGTCNLLCSTCYCFDVNDEVELSIDSGKRERLWDSCMLNNFAEVAGGEDFRDKLSLRTRHRLYRKFKYLSDKTGEMYCVGCGRCSKYCPADIGMVEVVNGLIDEDAAKAQTMPISAREV
jgi:sulfhydrogenase subunit beta (sulfur reductase)